MTTTRTAPLAPGQTTTRRAGLATITLQRTDTGTFTVATYQGPTRVEDWCRAYATQGEAIDAAEHTRRAFRAHGSDAAIEARRVTLVAVVMEQTRRMPRGMHDRAALAEAEQELDTLATLADLALLEDLRWTLAR